MTQEMETEETVNETEVTETPETEQDVSIFGEGNKPAEKDDVGEGANKSEDLDPKEEKGDVGDKDLDLKLGEDNVLPDDVVGDIKEFAKSNNLSNEAAQKLYDQQNKLMKAMDEQMQLELKEDVERWTQEVEADPVMGGENFDETKQLANAAIKHFGSDALTDLLVNTGYSNHPEVVRFLRKVGALNKSDSKVVFGSPMKQSKTNEELFYPSK